MIEQRTLFVNSKDRTQGDFSDYMVDFSPTDSFFKLSEGQKLYVVPTRYSTLNDFDNCSIYNQTFKLLRVDIATQQETEYLVTLDAGIYNTYTFQDELQAKLTTRLSDVDSTLSLVVNYDDDTNTYSFVVSSSGSWFSTYELQFRFDNFESTAAGLMGFEAGDYVGTLVSQTVTIPAPNPANMVFQPEINIFCSLVSSNYETTDEGAKASQLLFAINQDVGKNMMLTYDNDGHLFKAGCVEQFSNISFRFLDNQGRKILFKSNNRIALTFIKETHVDRTPQIISILEKLSGMQELELLNNQFTRSLQG